MKLTKRNTARRVTSGRITSPETRINPDTGKRELLLSYSDAQHNHRHHLTTRDLFLYAAGSNEEGELPDGLDRLRHHKFVIHLDTKDVAIGIDVVPARVYRSNVIPNSQLGVDTVKLTWLLDGAVCKITQRPAGVQAARLISLIAKVDELVNKGQAITATTKFGDIGRVVSISGDTIEVKLRAEKRTVQDGGAAFNAASLADEE
jgi:hypothetical protein